MIRTIKDLQNMYPEISPTIQVSEMNGASTDQVQQFNKNKIIIVIFLYCNIMNIKLT